METEQMLHEEIKQLIEKWLTKNVKILQIDPEYRDVSTHAQRRYLIKDIIISTESNHD